MGLCDVTGRTCGGYDLSLEEAGMYERKNGHCFFKKYIVEETTSQHKKDYLIKSEKSNIDFYTKILQKKYNDKNKERWASYIEESKEKLKEINEISDEDLERYLDEIDFYGSYWI